MDHPAEISASAPALDDAYLSLIDGLRGLAALAIVIYHHSSFFMTGPNHAFLPDYKQALPWFDGLRYFYHSGTAAVQLFWIISGFVFAFVYLSRAASGRSFFAHRFARLYPLHMLTLLVVTVLQAWAMVQLGHTIIYGGFSPERFVQHLFMASNWINYGGVYSFNGPIWSVSAEVLIYVQFWLLRGWIGRGGIAATLAVVAVMLGLTETLGVYSRVFQCGVHFFLGVAICQFLRSGRARGGPLLLVLAALLALGGGGLAIGGQLGLYAVAVPALGAALVLLAALAEPFAGGWLRGIARTLGNLSYGIYLWHIPVIMALILGLGGSFDMAELASQGWFLLLVLALVLLVAAASYRWFEAPARRQLRAILAPRTRPATA